MRVLELLQDGEEGIRGVIVDRFTDMVKQGGDIAERRHMVERCGGDVGGPLPHGVHDTGEVMQAVADGRQVGRRVGADAGEQGLHTRSGPADKIGVEAGGGEESSRVEILVGYGGRRSGGSGGC